MVKKHSYLCLKSCKDGEFTEGMAYQVYDDRDMVARIEGNSGQSYAFSLFDNQFAPINSYNIEIPFGAKDSELIEETIYIPDGCEASIEGNKIIIKKKQVLNKS